MRVDDGLDIGEKDMLGANSMKITKIIFRLMFGLLEIMVEAAEIAVGLFAFFVLFFFAQHIRRVGRCGGGGRVRRPGSRG